MPGYYFSYLFGLRVIDLNDAADFLSKAAYTSSGVRTPESGDYNVHTRNRLIGGQLGGEMTYRHCLWNVDVHGRVGPFLNIARTESSIVTTNTVGVDPLATGGVELPDLEGP